MQKTAQKFFTAQAQKMGAAAAAAAAAAAIWLCHMALPYGFAIWLCHIARFDFMCNLHMFLLTSTTMYVPIFYMFFQSKFNLRAYARKLNFVNLDHDV